MDEYPNVQDKVAELLKLTGPNSNPNINELWRLAKDIEGIKLNIKNFGYELARQLSAASPPRTVNDPGRHGLKSKASTQKDIESDWVAYWARRFGFAVVYHRKVWELCYVMQALHEEGLLREGMRGLGFACGEEPTPSLLAAYGVNVTVTDLEPEEAKRKGWVATNQHTSTLAAIHQSHLVAKDEFLARARLEYLDMNAIPESVSGYDFCWSICSFEHLGSIANGLAFVENSLKTLRPGGLSVHTTEFNFMNDDETIDNWPTVLFQKKHFSELADRLRAAGHWVADLDFDIGGGPMDKFIDLPPFVHDFSDELKNVWGAGNNHLKVMVDGFPSTCFGMIIRKAG